MKLTTGMVAVLAFVVVSALAMFTFLIYLERDITPLATLVINLVGLAVGSGVIYGKVAKVEKNVNGRMGQLIEKAAEKGHDVSAERAALEAERHV
jgi:hypothetical protein